MTLQCDFIKKFFVDSVKKPRRGKGEGREKMTRTLVTDALWNAAISQLPVEPASKARFLPYFLEILSSLNLRSRRSRGWLECVNSCRIRKRQRLLEHFASGQTVPRWQIFPEKHFNVWNISPETWFQQSWSSLQSVRLGATSIFSCS